MKQFFKILFGGLVLTFLGLTCFLSITREGRATVKAALFIPQVLDIQIKPLEWFTNQPTLERVRFPLSEGIGEGDLYRPNGQGPYAAVLLFLGVNPAARDDARIQMLGDALARSNMVTLFYWSNTMSENQIDHNDIDNLVSAFLYLENLDYVDPDRVGIGGFCIGASFAIMAAAQDSISDRVSFINALGPYFDMQSLLKSISSETTLKNASEEPWLPSELTREILALHLTKDLQRAEQNKILYSLNNPQTNNSIDTELSEEGLAVYRILTGLPRDQVDHYIIDIPDSTNKMMTLLSPSHYTQQLNTTVYILHDQDDTLIPAYESRLLADALQENNKVRYLESNLLTHVTPDSELHPSIARELLSFFLHIRAILLQST